ncbi:hypothetical protein ACI6PS_10725 [Flavobacterium sp. PLA-1-15]|uniref:hypothetical protein n=1 Tax=Flavobacterium sp. PLA-1-15 TaxID=3380533 RepID=UPI003B78CBD4
MKSNIKIKKGQIEDYAVQKTGDQTIDGKKTFTTNPRVAHTETPSAVINLEQMRAEMTSAVSATTLDTVLHSGNTSVKNMILEKPSETNDLAISADGLEFANYGDNFDNLTLKWTTTGDGELLNTAIEMPKKSGTLAVLEDISAHGLQEVLNNNSFATSETDIFIQRSQGNGSIQINDEQGVVIGGQGKGVIINGDSDGVKLGGSKIELNSPSSFNAPPYYNTSVFFQQYNYEEDSHQPVGSINLTDGNLTFQSSNETGIHYANDYAANFTDRSLVDKAYVDALAGGDLQQTLNKGSEANFSTDLLLRKISDQEGVGNVGEIQITDRIILNNNSGEGITINGQSEPIKLYGFFDIGGYGHTMATKASNIPGNTAQYLIIGDGNNNNTHYNYLKIGYKDSYAEASTKLKGTNLDLVADSTVKIKTPVLAIDTAVVNVDVIGQFSIGSSSNPNFVGMTYDNDYSEHYNDRSIPDVGYLNNQIANAVSETNSFHTVLSSEATLVLTADKTVNYFANTGGATIWTLPPVSGNTGKHVIIVNKGSENIYINTHEGNLELFDGAPLNAMPLIPGATYGLYCDGAHWTGLY